MYARVISFSGGDRDKRDAALETMRGTVIPMLQGYEGFAGYVGLFHDDAGPAKAILLWESKEAADTAEETLAERRQKITAQVGIAVETVEGYEVPVLELTGARA